MTERPHAGPTPDAPLSGARIVLLNIFGGPAVGGGEIVLLGMIRIARAAGAEAILVCPPRSEVGRRAAEAAAEVIELDLTPPGGLLRLPGLRARLRRLAPDVVQGTGFWTNVAARLVAPGGAAVVSTVQVLPSAARAEGRSGPGVWARRALERMRRRRVDVFLAVSGAVRDELVSAGIPPERVRVAPIGVDADALIAAAQGGVSSGAAGPTVGVLARLEPVKGVEHFIAAAAIVRERVPEARFLVAGDGSLRAALEALAARAGVTLLGAVPSSAGFLGTLDIVVAPSLSEAFGLVAAEASALGKPVIASDVGGLAEIVADGETGLLVAPGDAGALADAIVRLLEDREARARMGAAGAVRVRERFGMARMADELVAAYRELLEHRR